MTWPGGLFNTLLLKGMMLKDNSNKTERNESLSPRGWCEPLPRDLWTFQPSALSRLAAGTQGFTVYLMALQVGIALSDVGRRMSRTFRKPILKRAGRTVHPSDHAKEKLGRRLLLGWAWKCSQAWKHLSCPKPGLPHVTCFWGSLLR